MILCFLVPPSTIISKIFLLTLYDSVPHAVISMAGGLAILWIIIGGTIMLKMRDRIKSFVLSFSVGWKKKFVLFCTVLALIEEAITTTMTNLAPVFGVEVGEAAITASTNYLEVVLFHSVIIFIPWFVAWAWLLSRYDFAPAEVFLLFGITGTLAETMTFGLQNIRSAGFWVFVYGLMVYLPAYSVPEREVNPPRVQHYILAVVVPFVFGIPVALVVGLLQMICF